MKSPVKSLGWFATAMIVGACVGSDPGGDPTNPAAVPDAAFTDGSTNGSSGGPDGGADGRSPIGPCVFGTSRFGDGCKHGP